MKKTLITLFAMSCLTCVGMETQVQPIIQEQKITTRTICDPTYDVTFKSLFNDKEEANGINGNQRAISFLNGLLDLGIRSITFLPTVKDSDYTKSVMFDVLCECCCRRNEVDYVVDIEMQKSRQTFYFDRSVFYASKTLIERSSKGVNYSNMPRAIVLSFLDFSITEHIESAFGCRLMKTPININNIKTIPVCELSNKIQLYYFQLPKIANELQMQNSEINTAFTSLGKSWLSLLSYKYTPNAYTQDDEVILNADDFNINEINSAISVLESFRNGEKRALFLAEKSARDQALRTQNQVIVDAEKKGEVEEHKRGRVNRILDNFCNYKRIRTDQQKTTADFSSMERPESDTEISTTVSNALEDEEALTKYGINKTNDKTLLDDYINFVTTNNKLPDPLSPFLPKPKN